MSYELRPLSLAEILDAAFRLVQTEWKTLVGLSLIMQIPIAVLASRASWLFDPFAQPFDMETEPSPEMLIEMGLVGGGLGLLYLILYPFVAAAVTASVGNFYLGRRFELGDAARAGLASLLRLVLAYLVYLVALGSATMVVALAAIFLGAGVAGFLGSLGMLGTVVGFVGGATLFVAMFIGLLFAASVTSLLPPVVVLESKGIFQSVSRIFSLGRTAVWRVMGVIFTAGMIVGVPVFGAQVMIGFVPYLGVLIWAAFQAVGFAFTSAVAVVLYFDLRCRAEHYDLELLAEQVEAGPGLGER
jgi:hypothetical protein